MLTDVEMGNVSLFHLFQIVSIYVPGVAIIPATLLASFISVNLGAIVALLLLAIVGAGIAFRPRLAERLGLDRDYE